MKIKELHEDIERYLQHDCYCPHEIYSFDGFFYSLFYEDQECEKLGERHSEDEDFICCVAYPDNNEKYKPQIVVFYFENNKCVDALRYDATDNNIKLTKTYIEKGKTYIEENCKFDEYEEGSTTKALKEIQEFCGHNFAIVD